MRFLSDLLSSASKRETILLVFTFLVLFYYLVGLLAIVAGHLMSGNIDGLTPATISSDGCIYPEWGELKYGNIEILIRVHDSTEWHGSWGEYESSNSSELSYKSYIFTKDGENLLINNDVILSKNQSWEEVSIISYWNPWRLTKQNMSVENRGIVNCTQDQEGNVSAYGPSLVITGLYRTYYETNYVGGRLFIIPAGLLGYFIIKHIWRKRRLARTPLIPPGFGES